MSEYKFYLIREDGHIGSPPTALDLPNDDAAFQEAKKVLNGRDIEIWQGARLVHYLVSDES
jgi:hypothetical protein